MNNPKVNPDRIRLLDILSAIDDSESFAHNGLEDRKTLMATAYSIAVMGEAAGKLSAQLTSQ